MLGALKVLQSLVEGILEPLDGLDVLYVHGVWSKEQKTEGRKELLLFSNPHNRFNRTFLNADLQRLQQRVILERGFLLLMVNDAPLINAYTCRDSREEKNQVLYKYMAEKKKDSCLLVSQTSYPPPTLMNSDGCITRISLS